MIVLHQISRWLRVNRAAIAVSVALALALTLALESPRWTARPADDGAEWTGFLTYDTATYWANARALWRDGPALLYPNPYDLSANPPRLYFQLHTIAAAGLWRALGIGPAAQETLWRLVLGAAFFLLLDALAGAWFDWPPGHPRRRWAHLILCAGGGVAAMATLPGTLAAALIAGDPAGPPAPGLMTMWLDRFAALEEGRIFGRWLMAPARQPLFTTELYFHVLFFGAIVAMLRGRHRWALALLATAWLSHPFTAVLLGAVVIAFYAMEWVVGLKSRNAEIVESDQTAAGVNLALKPRLPHLTLALIIQLLGLAYYMMILPRFEVHRSVEANFKLPLAVEISTTSPVNLIFAHGFWLPLALGFLAAGAGRRAMRERPAARLTAAWALIVAMLATHQIWPFIESPVQPLHFTRSYLYVPLVLLGVAGWHALMNRWRPRLRPAIRAAGAALLVIVIVLDTLFFYAHYARGGWRGWGGVPWLDGATAGAVSAARDFPPGIAFTFEAQPTTGLGYLLPTLSDHRTVLAHGCNTPHLIERTLDTRVCLDSPNAPMLARYGVDYVLVDRVWARSRGLSILVDRALEGSERVFANETWEIWRRDDY